MPLDAIYGPETAARVRPALHELLAEHGYRTPSGDPWNERDAWLITYPDQFQDGTAAPLAVLRRFFLDHLAGALNGVHVLPFFPWSSDDGYAVSDYERVDPAYGSWDDIERLAASTRLMVDAVVNHMSAQSAWFAAWKEGNPEYATYFRVSDPTLDLSNVVRARQHPLLTEFTTSRGPQWVWTTFSADQVDLDFRSPELLLRIVGVLLDYARRGAAAIRLDAVCFLWKDEATPSIHLRQTHEIVRLFRACLDVTYPDVLLVTETNVPHDENVSYLGGGDVREAQVVYQFSLPPLVLHAVTQQDVTTLREWLTSIESPPAGTTFFNFLASHDGVGLRPLEGILDRAAVDALTHVAASSGGRVNRRSLPDGTSRPYELNATWYELVRGSQRRQDALQRHLATHAAMLALRGIPGIYVHSLFASPNDLDAVARTRMARSVNRHRFADVAALRRRLDDPGSRAASALAGMRAMLAFRRASPAFHPDGAQHLPAAGPTVLAVERAAADGSPAQVVVNLSDSPASCEIRPGSRVLASRAELDAGRARADLGPWGYVWIAG